MLRTQELKNAEKVESFLNGKTKKEYLKELLEKDFDDNYLNLKKIGLTSDKMYKKTKRFFVELFLS